MTLRQVWSEWKEGIPTDGGSMELPLQKLEAQKASNPYKNPKDRGLKTAVARRRHIAEFIKRLIRHKRLVLVLNGLKHFLQKQSMCHIILRRFIFPMIDAVFSDKGYGNNF